MRLVDVRGRCPACGAESLHVYPGAGMVHCLALGCPDKGAAHKLLNQRRPVLILGGVGLGVCSACRAPGAFFYTDRELHQYRCAPGVWMCDSCVNPEIPRARIGQDLIRARGEAV